MYVYIIPTCGSIGYNKIPCNSNEIIFIQSKISLEKSLILLILVIFMCKLNYIWQL
jgi:hypothetical protein